MISMRSGVLVAVNRPPGCGSISAIWLSGLAGSGLGLLGLTAATSKAASGAGAGSCADAAVAVSRMVRAKAHVERTFISTFFIVSLVAPVALFLHITGPCAEQGHVW